MNENEANLEEIMKQTREAARRYDARVSSGTRKLVRAWEVYGDHLGEFDSAILRQGMYYLGCLNSKKSLAKFERANYDAGMAEGAVSAIAYNLGSESSVEGFRIPCKPKYYGDVTCIIVTHVPLPYERAEVAYQLACIRCMKRRGFEARVVDTAMEILTDFVGKELAVTELRKLLVRRRNRWDKNTKHSEEDMNPWKVLLEKLDKKYMK
jgi:hypothetical protein